MCSSHLSRERRSVINDGAVVAWFPGLAPLVELDRSTLGTGGQDRWRESEVFYLDSAAAHPARLGPPGARRGWSRVRAAYCWWRVGAGILESRPRVRADVYFTQRRRGCILQRKQRGTATHGVGDERGKAVWPEPFPSCMTIFRPSPSSSYVCEYPYSWLRESLLPACPPDPTKHSTFTRI